MAGILAFSQIVAANFTHSDSTITPDISTLKNLRTIVVVGHVKEPGEFEWQNGIKVSDLIARCGGFLPKASKKDVIIERIVPGEQATKWLRVPLDFILEPGDRVVVDIEDSYYEQEIITLNGAFKNSGSYSLAFRGETFKEFMERIAKIDSMAHVKGGQFFRKGLNGRYRINFNFEKVLQGEEKDIILQASDSIYIPFEMLTVNITGEVTNPGHVLWKDGWKINDYINAVGGLTINGDSERIVLTYISGQKTNADKATRDPDPGSEIYVSYRPPPEPPKRTDMILYLGSIATALTAIATLVITILK
jgi:protein involved in polysaccharide export with SLBB domain